MITGDKSTHLIARGVTTSRFWESSSRRNYKLVGRENQLRGEIVPRFRCRILKQTRAALAFRHCCFAWTEHFDDVPGLSRADDRRGIGLFKIDMKKSRTPQAAFVRV